VTARARLGLAGALLLVGTGCAAPSGDVAGAAAAAGGDDVAGEVTVFAAASLAGAFEQIAEDVERDHPHVDVRLNLGGSSALAQQILSGAPADVFAAASPATMATVTEAGDAADPGAFARNTLQIAVPAGNPGDVRGLADLADEGRTVALCAPQVPCGAAASAVFAAAGLPPAPDTLEQDVRAALSKVRLGEVDAALVYRTDVLAAGDEVEGIEIAEAASAANDYLIATVTDAPNPRAAEAFRAAVLSEQGQRVLADAGFDRP
jgi:molybdate transport system substrate-binding protein